MGYHGINRDFIFEQMGQSIINEGFNDIFSWCCNDLPIEHGDL